MFRSSKLALRCDSVMHWSFWQFTGLRCPTWSHWSVLGTLITSRQCLVAAARVRPPKALYLPSCAHRKSTFWSIRLDGIVLEDRFLFAIIQQRNFSKTLWLLCYLQELMDSFTKVQHCRKKGRTRQMQVSWHNQRTCLRTPRCCILAFAHLDSDKK